MPLTLILTRHAKSAWDDPTVDDFDRPLNKRGRAAAQKMAKWLEDQDALPDAVVVSSAQRAMETWDRMAPIMPEPASIDCTPTLYLASSDLIQSVLKTQTARKVMIICHNPGIADFAIRALNTHPKHPDFRRYPTAATTVMAFDTEAWSDITWASATPVAFTVPKDL